MLVGIKNFLDNRPAAFALDAEGRLTGNAQLTGRMLVLKWIEILTLAGYLECGLGFAGPNYEFLTDLDYATRGGKVPFILGMDANAPPEAWDEIWWGEKKILEHLNAEVVTVRNSTITCTGAKNTEGGTNIDYYIMPSCFLGGIKVAEADFQVPFAPHYGFVLKIAADPSAVLIKTLVQPDLPKKICEYDRKQLEENSFQKTGKPENKISH